jgi:NAD(P)-dependent dehydrogenase (short-subunit alcohol dehydrogenase family)
LEDRQIHDISHFVEINEEPQIIKLILMCDSIFRLNDKLAVITGGGTGLGFGIAKGFSEAGARVVITGRREEVLRNACSKLGKNVNYVVNDVTDLASHPALVEDIVKRFGEIEILVNNAGAHLKKPPLEVTDDEFQKVIQTNLNAVFSLTREVGRRMSERNKGSIIMITSMAALYGIPKVGAYSAAKSALFGLVRSLAVDLSPHGVRVNAIAPGFIDSPMLRQALDSDPERQNRILDRTPMKSIGQPDDIAAAAVYLASDASKFVTGIQLPVDGGNSIGF